MCNIDSGGQSRHIVGRRFFWRKFLLSETIPLPWPTLKSWLAHGVFFYFTSLPGVYGWQVNIKMIREYDSKYVSEIIKAIHSCLTTENITSA